MSIAHVQAAFKTAQNRKNYHTYSIKYYRIGHYLTLIRAKYTSTGMSFDGHAAEQFFYEGSVGKTCTPDEFISQLKSFEVPYLEKLEAEKILEEKIKAAEDTEAACKAAEKVYEDAEKKHTEAAAEYTMAVSYLEKYKTIDISDRKAHKIVVTGVKNKVYTGKATTQSIRVTVDGKNATLSISYPGGRTSVGRHTVTIKGTGKYTGTLSFRYDILPKAVSSKKVKAASKSIKVSYKKVSGVTGYQIAYRQKGKSSWTYKTTKSTSKTISKLKAKKKYQLRVRTYKNVSGKNYYSSWSSISSAKTK